MSININLKNDEDINFWEIGVSGELDIVEKVTGFFKILRVFKK